MGKSALVRNFSVGAAIVAMGCGSGAPSAVEGTAVDDAGQGQLVASLGESGAPCQNNAECPADFVCQSVRVGEIEQQSCVPLARARDAAGVVDVSARDASSGADAAGAGADAAGGADASTGPVVDGGTPDSSDAGGVAASCSKALSATIGVVLPFPRPKCIVDTTVDTSSPITLTYACAGGAASATFGSQVFTGTEAPGGVTLQHTGSYSAAILGVSCLIDTTQTISGDLASGSLSYVYREAFAAGQSSLCPFLFLACSATGTVTVR